MRCMRVKTNSGSNAAWPCDDGHYDTEMAPSFTLAHDMSMALSVLALVVELRISSTYGDSSDRSL